VTLDSQQQTDRIGVNRLKPGMTASIDVQTGRSTVLNYIAKPILRAFSGAMSEK
jgi:adhesin transport system membrane fusion protein